MEAHPPRLELLFQNPETLPEPVEAGVGVAPGRGILDPSSLRVPPEKLRPAGAQRFDSVCSGEKVAVEITAPRVGRPGEIGVVEAVTGYLPRSEGVRRGQKGVSDVSSLRREGEYSLLPPEKHSAEGVSSGKEGEGEALSGEADRGGEIGEDHPRLRSRGGQVVEVGSALGVDGEHQVRPDTVTPEDRQSRIRREEKRLPLPGPVGGPPSAVSLPQEGRQARPRPGKYEPPRGARRRGGKTEPVARPLGEAATVADDVHRPASPEACHGPVVSRQASDTVVEGVAKGGEVDELLIPLGNQEGNPTVEHWEVKGEKLLPEPPGLLQKSEPHLRRDLTEMVEGDPLPQEGGNLRRRFHREDPGYTG